MAGSNALHTQTWKYVAYSYGSWTRRARETARIPGSERSFCSCHGMIDVNALTVRFRTKTGYLTQYARRAFMSAQAKCSGWSANRVPASRRFCVR
jgi:hypothetical protein